MNDVQLTSLIALEDTKPRIGRNQHAILRLLDTYPNLTNNEMSKLLGWDINRITPRTNELVKIGQVEEAEKRPCRITRRLAIAWRRKRISFQGRLA